MSFRFSGSGPGAQASDGCSVEVYRQVPYFGELEDFRALFHAGTRVLELGCATGRLTRRLLEWGTRVTAVDNSPEMLSVVPDGASRVLSDIESLKLDGRFDVALLASNFINHPAPGVRSAFVATARRHLADHGHFLLERYDPAWLRRVEPGPVGPLGDVAMSVEAVSRSANIVHTSFRYQIADLVWYHSSAAAPLEEGEIEALLSSYGFGAFAWSGQRRQWLSAVVQPH